LSQLQAVLLRHAMVAPQIMHNLNFVP
jgi:hypothetical protein